MTLSPHVCSVKQIRTPGWASHVSRNELLWPRGPRPGDPPGSDQTRPEPGAHRLPGHGPGDKAPKAGKVKHPSVSVCVCVSVCGGKGPQHAPQPCHGADSRVPPWGASPRHGPQLPTPESHAKAGGTSRGTCPLQRRVLPKAVHGNPSHPTTLSAVRRACCPLLGLPGGGSSWLP